MARYEPSLTERDMFDNAERNMFDQIEAAFVELGKAGANWNERSKFRRAWLELRDVLINAGRL